MSNNYQGNDDNRESLILLYILYINLKTYVQTCVYLFWGYRANIISCTKTIVSIRLILKADNVTRVGAFPGLELSHWFEYSLILATAKSTFASLMDPPAGKTGTKRKNFGDRDTGMIHTIPLLRFCLCYYIPNKLHDHLLRFCHFCSGAQGWAPRGSR